MYLVLQVDPTGVGFDYVFMLEKLWQSVSPLQASTHYNVINSLCLDSLKEEVDEKN